eukprot:7291201-Prymnesium_polylepis.2
MRSRRNVRRASRATRASRTFRMRRPRASSRSRTPSREPDVPPHPRHEIETCASSQLVGEAWTLFDGVKARLTLAAHKARELGDPGLNMTQHEIDEADWASHSFRRGADKQARIFAEKEGIPLRRWRGST